VSKIHKKARNALIAKAALSVARDHLTPPKPKKRRGRKLLFGGLIAGAIAAVVLKRDRVLALLPGHSESDYVPPPPAPPAPSNYDVSGPVANTATPIPAPDPVDKPAVDEAAEEEVPAAEAGEGESEGAEQAEALADERGEEPTYAAEPTRADTESLSATQGSDPETPAERAAPEDKPAEDQPSEWRTWSGRSVNP
jgi:hypothetical protein